MTPLLKTTGAAATLAATLALGGTGQAATLGSAALAQNMTPASVGSAPNAELHLIGGRHWRGGQKHWHRHHRHRDAEAAAALGAAGFLLGLSAAAAANATPPGYAPPVYVPPYPVYGYAPPIHDDPVPVYGDFYAGEVPYEDTAPDAFLPPPPPDPVHEYATADAGVKMTHAGSPAPWTPEWYRYCEGKYKSFNPETGYFTAYSGEQKFCR